MNSQVSVFCKDNKALQIILIMYPFKRIRDSPDSGYFSFLVKLAFHLSFYMGRAFLDFISRLAVLTGFE